MKRPTVHERFEQHFGPRGDADGGSAAAHTDPHVLEVAFYPERVQRAAPPRPLTPSQAVRLPDDDTLAAAAAATAGSRRTVEHPSPADSRPAGDHAQPHAQPGDERPQRPQPAGGPDATSAPAAEAAAAPPPATPAPAVHRAGRHGRPRLSWWRRLLDAVTGRQTITLCDRCGNLLDSAGRCPLGHAR